MNDARKMTGTQFVHLHVHSTYSPMRGVSSLEELCALAQQQGSPTIALTDTNGLYGAIRFIEQAKQHGLRQSICIGQGYGRRALLLREGTEFF